MMQLVRFGVVAPLLLAGTALAQGGVATTRDDNAPVRHATYKLFFSNALIGGASATVRALAGDADPWLAFLQGSFGGAIHYAGKNLTTQDAAATGLLGLSLASSGVAIVANAGRGDWLLEQVDVPLGPVRLRFTPRAERKFHARLNAYDAILTVWIAGRQGEFDWAESARRGVLVYRTPDYLRVGTAMADGMALGPIAVYANVADDPMRTVAHEAVHVHQHWYSQAVWGADAERALRRTKVLGWLPRWIDPGIGGPALVRLERALLGGEGYTAFREFEAGQLSGPPRTGGYLAGNWAVRK